MSEIIIQSNFQLTSTICLDLNQSSGNKKLTEVKLMMLTFWKGLPDYFKILSNRPLFSLCQHKNE